MRLPFYKGLNEELYQSAVLLEDYEWPLLAWARGDKGACYIRDRQIDDLHAKMARLHGPCLRAYRSRVNSVRNDRDTTLDLAGY